MNRSEITYWVRLHPQTKFVFPNTLNESVFGEIALLKLAERNVIVKERGKHMEWILYEESCLFVVKKFSFII